MKSRKLSAETMTMPKYDKININFRSKTIFDTFELTPRIAKMSRRRQKIALKIEIEKVLQKFIGRDNTDETREEIKNTLIARYPNLGLL